MKDEVSEETSISNGAVTKLSTFLLMINVGETFDFQIESTRPCVRLGEISSAFDGVDWLMLDLDLICTIQVSERESHDVASRS